MPRLHIDEKTSVPLFAVVSAILIGVSSVGGAFVWFAAISTKADIATAKNIEQDQSIRDIQGMLVDIRDRTIRTETSVNIILKKVK